MDKPIPEAVAWPFSILEAGNWREVYMGTKHMRLEVSYPYEAWERLMAALAAAQQQGQAPLPSAHVGVDMERFREPVVLWGKAYEYDRHGREAVVERRKPIVDELLAIIDAAAQQPAAVDGVVGTVLRRDNRDGSEVLDHQIDLDPEFDERLNNMPAGTVVRLYAAPVRDLTLKQLADVAALAAQRQETGA